MFRFLLILPLLLAACSPAADNHAAVGPDENRQLDRAAAELDANMIGNTTP